MSNEEEVGKITLPLKHTLTMCGCLTSLIIAAETSRKWLWTLFYTSDRNENYLLWEPGLYFRYIIWILLELGSPGQGVRFNDMKLLIFDLFWPSKWPLNVVWSPNVFPISYNLLFYSSHFYFLLLYTFKLQLWLHCCYSILYIVW